jgi:hypothetical protein
MFMDFLRQHRSGASHGEATEALQALVAAVTEEKRAGKLTIVISLRPLAKGDGIETSVSIKLAAPEPVAGTSIFYPTPSNDLVRQDPRQQAMELQEIGPAEAHRGLA